MVNLLSNMAHNTSLSISSYNCRGFNNDKKNIVSDLCVRTDFVFLQEHWMTEEQLGELGYIEENVSYMEIGIWEFLHGFDNSVILEGRPYGGCAILWKSSILADVLPLSVDSRRICAVRVCSSNWKLLLVNVYMPYENDSVSTEEFAQLLSVLDDLIITYPDYNVVIGGDFNVDFSRGFTRRY